MFSVKPLWQNVDTNAPICSGITFGYVDIPLIFEVTSEKVPSPYYVNFKVSKDASKKSLELTIGNLSQNQTDLIFYNPNENGVSGLKAPIGFLTLENKYILGLMFFVDLANNSPCYRLTYEFYDGLLPEPRKSE